MNFSKIGRLLEQAESMIHKESLSEDEGFDLDDDNDGNSAKFYHLVKNIYGETYRTSSSNLDDDDDVEPFDGLMQFDILKDKMIDAMRMIRTRMQIVNSGNSKSKNFIIASQVANIALGFIRLLARVATY